MDLKAGVVVAITVPKEWANSTNPGAAMHHFKGDDTEHSQLYAGELIQADSMGLWVEGSKDKLRTRILVPWSYVLAVRVSPSRKGRRAKIGFGTHYEEQD